MSISIPLHVPYLFSDGKKIQSKVFELNSKMKRKSKSTILIFSVFFSILFFLASSGFELIDCGLSPLVCVIQFPFFIYLRLLFRISILDFILTFGTWSLDSIALGTFWRILFHVLKAIFFSFWFSRLHENKISVCSSEGFSIFYDRKTFFFLLLLNLKTLNWKNATEIEINFFSPLIRFFTIIFSTEKTSFTPSQDHGVLNVQSLFIEYLCLLSMYRLFSCFHNDERYSIFTAYFESISLLCCHEQRNSFFHISQTSIRI